MEAQVFPATPLLHPEQVSSAKDEIKSLEAKLSNKHIEDKGEVSRQLRRAVQDFEKQAPVAPSNPDEEGRMVKRSRELLDKILVGMPSQEEMRKAPPGAVEKHMKWEARNKPRIMEWRHIMRRLTAGSSDRDAANLELHRPTRSTLNMDSAQIPGAMYFMPETTGPSVTFTDAQIATLRALDPALADRLATLTNPQRAQVKEIIGIGLDTPVDPVARAEGLKGAARKREISAEQKAKMAAGRAAAKARREAKS